MANSDIKVTNLEYYKVGTGDCEIYLGTTKLYPLTPPIPPSYEGQYLTFRVLSGGTLGWSGSTTANTLSYSLNSVATWSTPSTSVTLNLNRGDTVMFKGECVPVVNSGIGNFKTPLSSTTFSVEVEGNPMSLLYGDNFSGQTSLSGNDYAFSYLFDGCKKLVSAENLSLPATTLSNNCYASMFSNCTSLTTAPELPATTLATKCYQNMFGVCTSLLVAPELPATTLAVYCYQYMFSNCTSLTTAPELPATTLANYCYMTMFQNCTNLSAITCLATDISAVNCTYDWVNNVAPSGVFTKAAGMTGWTGGIDGIPSGWTVQDYNP